MTIKCCIRSNSWLRLWQTIPFREARLPVCIQMSNESVIITRNEVTHEEKLWYISWESKGESLQRKKCLKQEENHKETQFSCMSWSLQWSVHLTHSSFASESCHVDELSVSTNQTNVRLMEVNVTEKERREKQENEHQVWNVFAFLWLHT
jgi:hypothetical protein